jgi:VanZ family protein
LKKIAFKKFIPAIAWFFVVMVLMFLPGEDVPSTDWLHIDYFDKLVHTGIFGLMGFLFSWPFLKSNSTKKQLQRYFLMIAAAVSAWGFVAELIQKYFIPGRSYDLFDWLADTIGALASFLILKLFFFKPTNTKKVA